MSSTFVTLAEVLEARGGPLLEEEVWSLLLGTAESLVDVYYKGKAFDVKSLLLEVQLNYVLMLRVLGNCSVNMPHTLAYMLQYFYFTSCQHRTVVSLYNIL